MQIAVIGLGSMGKRRIRLLKRFEEVDFIVGIDSREDRRNEVNSLYSCVTFESLNQALDKYPEISTVFVCTSPLSHHLIINDALEKGLNVFSELNLVQDGYEENIKLAKEKGLTLFMSSTFLYREEIKYIIKKFSNTPGLNYIYHVGQYLPDWHTWETYNEFFVSNSRTNGCRELMAIELPWILKTFGNVAKFQVVADKISDLKVDYKDNYCIQFCHENGNKGIVIIDVVSPKAVRNLEVFGQDKYLSWAGSPEFLEEYDPVRKQTGKVILAETVVHQEGYRAFITENAYFNEIQEFFDALNHNKVPEYGFEQDRKVLNLINQIEGIYE